MTVDWIELVSKYNSNFLQNWGKLKWPQKNISEVIIGWLGLRGGVGLREIRTILINRIWGKIHMMTQVSLAPEDRSDQGRTRKTKWMMWKLLFWAGKEQANLVSDVSYGMTGSRCKSVSYSYCMLILILDSYFM